MHFQEGWDLHRSAGSRSIGERDRAARLQHREGAGPRDFNTGRERVSVIAAAGREATGETVSTVKLEVEGAGQRALSEKKREHDREAS
jgi:hypothetical protein